MAGAAREDAADRQLLDRLGRGVDKLLAEEVGLVVEGRLDGADGRLLGALRLGLLGREEPHALDERRELVRDRGVHAGQRLAHEVPHVFGESLVKLHVNQR